MLVLDRVAVDALQLIQQLGDRGRRGGVGPYRNRVDQQAHHRFRARQLGRPTRNRGAERHIALAGHPHQQLRPPALQHRAHRGAARTGQLGQGRCGLDGHSEGCDGAAPRLARRAHQGRDLEPRHHLTPGRLRGAAILVGQPGDETAIRRGRGQPLPVIAGEGLLQQDRQRPPIRHDVVNGEHKPVLIARGADQSGPECRLVSQVADRGAFVRAQPLNLLIDVTAGRVQLDIPPRDHRICGKDLHRFTELFVEARHQVRMPVDHGLHRPAQPLRVEFAFHGDTELYRIQVDKVWGEAGVEQQSLLHGRQRQHVHHLAL